MVLLKKVVTIIALTTRFHLQSCDENRSKMKYSTIVNQDTGLGRAENIGNL